MLPQRVAVCLRRSYGGWRYFASSMAPTSAELPQSKTGSMPSSIYGECRPFPAVTQFDSSAFRSASSAKLLGTIMIFAACKVKPVVNRSEALLSLSNRVLGATITNAVMRKTFFAHFCGGESSQNVTGTIESLRKQGIGSILDYAAEKDVSSEAAKGDQTASFEENLNCSLHAIRSSAEQPKGYAAVKLTSIGSPHLLLSASALVIAAQRLFIEFSEHATGIETQTASRDVPSLRESEFLSAAKSILNVPEDEARTVYTAIHDMGASYASDAVDGDSISMYEWTEYFSPHRLGRGSLSNWLTKSKPHENCAAFAQLGGMPKALSDEEVTSWEQLCSRVARLSDCAAEYPNVRVLVDAEQTFLQPAIDQIVMLEQQRCNGRRAVVYNTYQAYLKDALPRLLADIKRSEHLNHRFGVKLVRGAYMVQERELCQTHGYADPINKDMASSHVNFDACVSKLLDKMGTVELLMGTHNENSVLKAINLLQEKGFQPEETPVAFAQLLGMCDHVSLTLGKAGYSAFKYVPYGPVGEVMPYLLRRAQENSDLLGSSTKEMGLIAQELRRRVRESPLLARFTAQAAEPSQQHPASESTSSSAESKEHDLKRHVQK
eukprot:GHVS01066282.1.p1 GENE.GHVS01066282.1~~GHVS01066282.1.p1  ORF type:complete len:606 (+),score=62.34 GHVS01066282.1:96-1913(+)